MLAPVADDEHRPTVMGDSAYAGAATLGDLEAAGFADVKAKVPPARGREGRFGKAPAPFMGYFFLLEDCPAVHRERRNKEPYFKVDPAFARASYSKRYELLCRRLVGQARHRRTPRQGLNQSPPADARDIFGSRMCAHIRPHGGCGLKRDGFSSIRHPALAY